MEDVFTWIYQSGYWGVDEEGRGTSGEGSAWENVQVYISYLQDFLKKHQIRSVVDLGCGDWQFSQFVEWGDIEYVGIDVVKEIIEKNKLQFASPARTFIHVDGIHTSLPSADLLLCKDVFQHLTHEDIFNFLPQINKFKNCLITNDVDKETLSSANLMIDRGHERALDLTFFPFYLQGEKALTYKAGNRIKQTLWINNG